MRVSEPQPSEDVLVFRRGHVELGSGLGPGEPRVLLTVEEGNLSAFRNNGPAQAAREAFAKDRAAALETLASLTKDR